MDDDDVPQLLETNDDGRFDSAGRPLERPKVPLTLLTGYLGAGKSTLLDYILTADHGYRIAVCMNDFGDTTDIEAKSLQLSNSSDPNAPSTSMLALPNGCLCCSVKDMGIAAIEDMVVSQREKIDWVMVELTGLADPAPIAKDFWANEEMGDLVLDSVICVVDSRNVLKQLSEVKPDGSPNEAQKQVACADVILLNKADLVAPSDLDRVAAAVADINPTLRLHRTVRGNVPLSELLDLRAFTSPAVAALPEPTAACGADCTDAHDHDHAHAHGAPGPNTISTVTVRLPTLTAAQFDALNAFLESLLWKATVPTQPSGKTWSPTTPEVLRTKGYAVLDDGSARVIQGVADLFEVRELPASTEGSGNGGSEPQPKIVFIGRGVGEELGQWVREYVGV